MAKRKQPDPAITEHWSAILRPLGQKVDRREKLLAEAREELGAAVRAAFSAGVLVGPIKEAIGRSGSRVYQIKFALRDQERNHDAHEHDEAS